MGGADSERRDVVCFDLDGTLLDPAGSIRAAIEGALALHGYGAFAEHEVLIGMPLRDILRLRTDDPDEVEAMVERFRDLYTSETWRLARFIPGTLEVVGRCREAGLQTAIVTTKGEQEAIDLLSNLQVADRFDTIVGDDDVRPTKPDPAPVIAACGRLGRHPRDACMIGDTVFDIEAGRAAGAYTIGVQWGHGRSGHGVEQADAVVADPQALWDAIQDWHAGGPSA